MAKKINYSQYASLPRTIIYRGHRYEHLSTKRPESNARNYAELLVKDGHIKGFHIVKSTERGALMWAIYGRKS